MASFIKDLFRVGISNIFIIFLGLGTSIITARYIGPEGNGVIASLVVYPSLFMTFGSLGIRQSTTYFLGKKIFNESQIKTAITQIWVLTTALSLLICFVLMYYFSNSGKDFLYLGLALLPIPFNLFITYNSGIFLGRNDIGTFNKINWLPNLITFLSTLVFVVFLHLDIFGAMLASIGGPLLMAIILIFKNKFVKAFNFTYDFKVIMPMLSLGVTYAFSLLIINLNYKIDVILLDKLSTSYELGIYSKGANITQYLWQIPMLLSTIVFARSAVSKNDMLFSYKIVQLLRISLLLIGVAAIILMCLSKLIIIGMYGIAFKGSVDVLVYLLPGVLILTLFKVMNMDLAGKGKPWVAIKAMIPALLINLVMNIILIPKYGANGAAISSTVSYGIAGILFLYFYSIEVQIPMKTILTFKKSDFNPIVVIINKVLKKRDA